MTPTEQKLGAVGPGRLHALVDGVFAIAMTLLVLDLPRPSSASHLTVELGHAWPTYVAYLVSFGTVGLIWIEHHGMMAAVRAINRRFLELTLAFLLCVSIIPWPTALAAEFARSGGSSARFAALLYTGTMLLMGITFALGWRYLARHPRLVADVTQPALSAGARRAFLGSLVYAVALLVAIASPYASFALDAAVAVYFGVSRSRVPELLIRAGASSAD